MNSSTFSRIPSNIFAYWLSDAYVNVFVKSSPLSLYGYCKQGLSTSDNDTFLRIWHEVSNLKECFDATDSINAFASGIKWFPFNKGGEFRKWYGNQDFVIDWYLDGKKLKTNKKAVIRNPQFYFEESISWSKIASNSISFRQYPKGFIFDSAGCSFFANGMIDKDYLFALLNSNVIQSVLYAISPTLNYVTGQIETLPVIYDSTLTVSIGSLVQDNVNLSKKDWDSFEESWNFKRHPLA